MTSAAADRILAAVLARPVRFSTADVREAERSDRWEQWNRAALIGLDCRTPGGHGLRGEEITLDAPGVTLGLVRAEPHEVDRTAAIVDAGPAEAVVVYAVLRGRTTFSDAGVTHPVAAGDLAVVDADRPFRRGFATAFTELALKFPRPAPGTAAGPVFRHASPLAAVRIRALGRQLAVPSGLDEPGTIEAVRTVALDLFDDLTTGEQAGDRLALARLLVEQQLGDPGLSASRLATTLGVSLRQLTRVFASAGTSFPAHLTERRLARAATLLPSLPVAEVAILCGFSSPTYFSRVFRDHHGMPPGQFAGG